MPTYEYKCSDCNHTFEIIQSMKEDPLKICPDCHKETLKKLVSGGAGLIFKGSGFYLTDYKNKPATESKSTKTESKEPKKDTKTSVDKSNAAPETKTAAPAESKDK
jgi:putative FmdB family regulatory protein